MKIIKSICSKILDFVLPPTCYLCQEIVKDPYSLCCLCWPKIVFYTNQSKPGFSAVSYNQASSKLILRFKYHDECTMANLFARWILLNVPKEIFNADILTPIPLHWKRLVFRQYNQVALLGRALYKNSLYSYMPQWIPDLLMRTRHTKPQQGCINREKNVSQAFSINPKYNIKKKKILLLDDVWTSGATLNECKRILKMNQAKNVTFLTIARAGEDDNSGV